MFNNTATCPQSHKNESEKCIEKPSDEVGKSGYILCIGRLAALPLGTNVHCTGYPSALRQYVSLFWDGTLLISSCAGAAL